jgi:hypothetical protein
MHTSLLAFFLFFVSNIFAQTYFGDVTLSNQNDVNQFSQQYIGINRIEGRLLIGGNDTFNLSDITSLAPLQQLNTIQSIYISNNAALKTLNGLQRLKTVDGFTIYNNPQLENLNGLDSLEYAYSFTLRKNDTLPNLQGLKALKETYFFTVDKCKNLVSCQGVTALKKIIFRCYITDNPRLKSINGFDALEGVAEIYVTNNDSLLHFGYFPKATKAVWLVEDNDNLIDFAEVANAPLLKEVYTRIAYNDKISNFKGINKIHHVTIAIENNLNLSSVNSLDSVYSLSTGISGQNIQEINFPNTKIVRNFAVRTCPKFTILNNPLPQVDSVTNFIDIYQNDSLKTIHEDFGPKYIHEFLVHDNPKLEFITGYEGFEKAGLYVNFNDPFNDCFSIQFASPNFTAITGFNQLKRASIEVKIVGEAGNHFDKINGFNGLDSLDQFFRILHQTNLINTTYSWQETVPKKLIGFSNLKYIGKELNFEVISDTIAAFDNLETLGFESFMGAYQGFYVSTKNSCYTSENTFSKVKIIKDASLANCSLYGNGKLFKFPNLEKVIKGKIITYENDQLISIQNIYPKLKNVGSFTLVQCKNLKSLDGIEGIEEFKQFDLSGILSPFLKFTENDTLIDCSALCTVLQNATFSPANNTKLTLDNPNFPCNDVASLLAYCDTLTSAYPQEPILQSKTSIKVYPNPIQTGLLSIEVDAAVSGQYQLQLSDASGRVIMSGLMTLQEGKGAVNVTMLKEGIHYLSLKKGTEVYGVGFVKE